LVKKIIGKDKKWVQILETQEKWRKNAESKRTKREHQTRNIKTKTTLITGTARRANTLTVCRHFIVVAHGSQGKSEVANSEVSEEPLHRSMPELQAIVVTSCCFITVSVSKPHFVTIVFQASF
jgi:hypothetical protein